MPRKQASENVRQFQLQEKWKQVEENNCSYSTLFGSAVSHIYMVLEIYALQ